MVVHHSALVSMLASESGELCHGGHRTVRGALHVCDGRERESKKVEGRLASGPGSFMSLGSSLSVRS
jgi:hypothetical protein